MTRFLLVCLGGAVGTGARYALSTTLGALLGTQLPYGTLAVNLLGSFLIGAVVQVAAATDLITPTSRLVLMSGFLGGFTTYSAFNNETVIYLQASLWDRALLNVGITLLGCLLAGFAGIAVARRFVG